MLLDRILPTLLSTLWPARCAACAAFVSEDTSFCPSCAADLVALGPSCSGCAMPFEIDGGMCAGCLHRPFPFSVAKAVLAYGGSLTQALLRFKHGGHRYLAAPLARYMAPAVWPLWQQADLVCPVPLHRDRLRRRGFNQALELLRAMRRQWPRPQQRKVTCDLLVRTLDTPPLAHGSPAARARAVAGAFAVRPQAASPAGHGGSLTASLPEVLSGQNVLVVDDVMTSGATLAECARTLLSAGAGRVTVAALARAI
jgi:predicted amidophosphoribosyltransferase